MEFWAVATRPSARNGLGWEKGRTRAKLIDLSKTFTLLLEDMHVFDTWLHLVFENNVSGKRTHDVRLAATLLANEIDYLVTFNIQDFDTLIVHPDDIRGMLIGG